MENEQGTWVIWCGLYFIASTFISTTEPPTVGAEFLLLGAAIVPFISIAGIMYSNDKWYGEDVATYASAVVVGILLGSLWLGPGLNEDADQEHPPVIIIDRPPIPPDGLNLDTDDLNLNF